MSEPTSNTIQSLIYERCSTHQLCSSENVTAKRVFIMCEDEVDTKKAGEGKIT